MWRPTSPSTGVHITAGNADGADYAQRVGKPGCTSTTHPGAAVLHLNNCIFEANLASQIAGGLEVERIDCVITGCDFLGNRSEEHGGAAGFRYSRMEIVECRFEDNEALTGGGGGLHIIDLSAEGTLRDCTLVGNQAGRQGGGGIYHAGSAVGLLVIEGCLLEGNQGARPGLRFGRGYSR